MTHARLAGDDPGDHIAGLSMGGYERTGPLQLVDQGHDDQNTA
jgi:hypothetical protein